MPRRGSPSLAAKFWLDSDDVLHVEHLEERGRIRVDYIRAAVQAAVDAELAATAPAHEAPAAEDVQDDAAEAPAAAAVVEDVPAPADAEEVVEADAARPVVPMTGGELQTVREWLGLTTESLAGLLGVRHDTVRRWESGRDRVPARVREEIERVEADTAAAVTDLATTLAREPDPVVVVYRTDADLHAARPDLAHLTARWWRHVVARAMTDVDDVAVGTRAELDALDGA